MGYGRGVSEADDPDPLTDSDGMVALVAVLVLLITAAVLIKVFLA
jgi:hypothetical protein